MGAVRAVRECNNPGLIFDRVVTVIEFSNSFFACQRVIGKVNKSALDVQIAWFDGTFAAAFRGQIIILRNE